MTFHDIFNFATDPLENFFANNLTGENSAEKKPIAYGLALSSTFLAGSALISGVVVGGLILASSPVTVPVAITLATTALGASFAVGAIGYMLKNADDSKDISELSSIVSELDTRYTDYSEHYYENPLILKREPPLQQNRNSEYGNPLGNHPPSMSPTLPELKNAPYFVRRISSDSYLPNQQITREKNIYMECLEARLMGIQQEQSSQSESESTTPRSEYSQSESESTTPRSESSEQDVYNLSVKERAARFESITTVSADVILREKQQPSKSSKPHSPTLFPKSRDRINNHQSFSQGQEKY